MFNLLKYLFWVLSLFVFISCHQDPLKNIPEELREGLSYTSDAQSILDSNFLSSDLLRVTFNRKKDLILPFKEGEEAGHIIKIESLYEDARFDIDVKIPQQKKSIFDESFKWEYDKSLKQVVIVWKPGGQFTQYRTSVDVKVPLHIILKQLNNPKHPPFVITKDLILKVEKSYESPEIVKIEYGYFVGSVGSGFETYTPIDVYELIEDDKFYEIPTNEKVNLRLNRPIYVKGEKHNNYNSEDYSIIDYNANGLESKNHIYDSKITYYSLRASQRGPLTKDVYSRLGKSVYVKKEDEQSCASSSDTETKNGNTICYVELENGGDTDLDLNLEIYETYYVLPETLNYEDNGTVKQIVFDSTFDNIYKKLSGEFSSNCYALGGARSVQLYKEEGGDGSDCYVQVLSGDTFIKRSKVFYFQMENLEIKKAYPISKDQFQKKFRLMPKGLKLSIAGYNYVLLNDPMNLVFSKLPFNPNYSDYTDKNIMLRVYVRDLNYIHEGTSLETLKTKNIFSPLKMNFYDQTYTEDNDLLVFLYELNKEKFETSDLNDRYLKSKGMDDSFSFYFRPSSRGVDHLSGKKVSLDFHVLPEIHVLFEEHLKDLLNEQENDKTIFKMSHKLKRKYFFHPDSFEDFSQIVKLKKDLKDFDSEVTIKSLKDILNINLYLDNCFNSTVGNRDAIAIDESCSCGEVYQKENVLVTDCNFNTTMTLDSIKKEESFYVAYEYILKDEVSFRDDLFENSYRFDLFSYMVTDHENQKIKVDLSDAKIDYHFFFNLKPTLVCSSDLDSVGKKCKISYPLYLNTTNFHINMEKMKEFLFFDVTCEDSNGEKKVCSCNEEIQKNLLLEMDRAEIFKECSFGKNEIVKITTSLKTNSDNIFFIDLKKEVNLSSKDLRRTKTYSIEL